MDKHWARGGTVFSQLPVSGARGHHRQLDRVQGVGVQDLNVEPGIHHGRLNTLNFFKLYHFSLYIYGFRNQFKRIGKMAGVYS